MLLCTWIVELKLNELNDIKASMDNDKLSKDMVEQLEEEWQTKMTSFDIFLDKHKTHMDEETIFQVLQSHGKIDDCIKFAELIKRYDTVIMHYINKQEHDKALHKVTEIEKEDIRNDTMLRYASIFINKCAKLTIDELRKEQYKTIDIPKLMPAFMNIREGEDMRRALDYITNHCINLKHCKSKTVHNMAFYFHSRINDAQRIIQFLEKQEVNKAKGHSIYFEVDYALNVCKQNEKRLRDELAPKIKSIASKQKTENPNSSENQYIQKQ